MDKKDTLKYHKPDLKNFVKPDLICNVRIEQTSIKHNQLGNIHKLNLKRKRTFNINACFFEVPNGLFADNRKVGTSSVVLSIVKWIRPDEYINLINKNIDLNKIQLHSTMDIVEYIKEENKKIFLLVREPISRFISGCNQGNIKDIDNLINLLEKEKYKDIHFRKQTHFLQYSDNINCYLFPEELDRFYEESGLENLNLIINHKEYNIVLSDEQLEKVKEIYKNDIILYEKLYNNYYK